ncbi:hypothetical protein SNE25_14905 [Mucilaginibacter sabulilitoris]|uniref:DUF4136 domain-containing protein n=1 Tax=Mucilaginibacter sabulilitoris TaxID=1173583 RepID=A0ABZ0TUL8_9SPHI|nr:hypothetical protein [Mucilaginibacter sabulilitoris]WPU96810.1 hypothetical protein SNE25_14905 [Mucilaginibacter sabulilitoris]
MKFIFALLVIVTACSNNQKQNNCKDANLKLLDYGTFTIQVPKQWRKMEVGPPEDSYVGYIQINEKALVSFDFGRYSNSLNEDDNNYYYQIEDGKVFMIEKSSTPNNVKLKYFGIADSATLEKVRRNKIEWIKVDGKTAKLITPKKHGVGTTGVYIDNLWIVQGSKIKIQINAQNLPKEQEKQLLSAIRSLKFYQKKPFIIN